MNIKIHRGISQIGGCITEIESQKGTKILIDLGHNLPEGDTPSKDPLDNQEQLDKLLTGISAVFYTHPHGDHLGFETKVRAKGIPQYMGKVAIEMMLILKDSTLFKMKDPLKRKQVEKSREAINSFIEYEPKKVVIIEDRNGKPDIKITPYFVSHSAADAYMFVVECDGKKVLHTGDFRDHGYRGKGLLPTVEYYVARKKIDVLVTEGTMLSRDDSRLMSEQELQNQAEMLMRKYDNVFVMCSSMDADRLSSFFFATCKFPNRKFVVDGYQYQMMRKIDETLGASEKGYRYRFRGMYYYRKHKDELMESIPKNGVTILIRNNRDMRKMIDEVYPLMDPAKTCLIYSQFRGYILNGHPAFQEKTYNFVHQKDWHIEYLHTSGHASKEALAAVCKKVNPLHAIIPIHRDADSDFCSLDIPQELKDKVITETPQNPIGDINIIIK